MNTVKSLVLIVVVLVIAAMAVYIKVAYFPKEQEQTKETHEEGLFESFKDLNADFQKILDDTKEGSQALRQFIDSISNTSTPIQLSDAEIEQLQKKLKERQQKDIEVGILIQQIREAISEDWTVERDDESISVMDGVLFTIEVSGLSECQKDDLAVRTKKQYAFYKADNQQQVLDALSSYNQGLLDKQCRAEIFMTNSIYTVVDTCSNDVVCEDFSQLQNELKNYFNNL